MPGLQDLLMALQQARAGQSPQLAPHMPLNVGIVPGGGAGTEPSSPLPGMPGGTPLGAPQGLPGASYGGSGAGIGPEGAGGGILMPDDPRLMTKRGVTLRGGAMRSLIDIARRSDILPGIQELGQISDSYRTPAQQAAAYANKPGLAAPPGQSYHQKGLAIDAGWWSQHPELVRMLMQAGWNRFSPTGEPWHWSYKVTG